MKLVSVEYYSNQELQSCKGLLFLFSTLNEERKQSCPESGAEALVRAIRRIVKKLQIVKKMRSTLKTMKK